ncbi:MAG: flagellar motor protein MotB [Lachnospiraceae bacterium]|nr:flagellar motor protein MotB [Lachnospiraceae bacterium]
MAKKQKQEDAPAGSPAWMATFSDLMNLLLCFFVLLFSMSTVDAQKFEEVAASFSQTFSVFTAGALSIGDGLLISNGVSQLNELDDYINSTGKSEEADDMSSVGADGTELEEAQVLAEVEAMKMEKSEEMAELVEEAIAEAGMEDMIEMDFTSQYVQLTLNGSLLFDSGSAKLSANATAVMDQVGIILERYGESVIEIEGHTDSVPFVGGAYASNNELSSARALAVFYYLIDHTNLDPSLLKHSGRGEYCPIADNSTPEGRALNRRVEIKIYNSLSDY